MIIEKRAAAAEKASENGRIKELSSITKSNRGECNNWIVITLLPVISKIFRGMMLEWI